MSDCAGTDQLINQIIHQGVLSLRALLRGCYGNEMSKRNMQDWPEPGSREGQLNQSQGRARRFSVRPSKAFFSPMCRSGWRQTEFSREWDGALVVVQSDVIREQRLA